MSPNRVIHIHFPHSWRVMRSLFLLGEGVVVLLRKDSNLQICSVFLDQEGRLVIIDVTYNGKQSFRVVVVYVPKDGGWTDFFKNLERFLVTLKTLVLLGTLTQLLMCGLFVLDLMIEGETLASSG